MLALTFRQVNLFGADRCRGESIARCLNDLAGAHPRSIKPRTGTEVLGAVELVARASGRRTLSSPWCNDYPFAP